MGLALDDIARGWFRFLICQFTTNGKQDVDLHDLQRRIVKLEQALGKIPQLTAKLKGPTDALSKAEASQGVSSPTLAEGSVTMPPQVLDDLAAQVTTTVGVVNSAVTLINGIAARIQAAVDAAIAGGATAAQLAPVTDEIASLKTASDALATAVAANP